MRLKQIFFIFGFIIFAILSMWANMPSRTLPDPYTNDITLAYTLADTIPLTDRKGDFLTDKKYNPFDITTKEIEQKVEYDAKTGNYIIYEKVGDQYYRTPTYMTFDEYMSYMAREQEKKYFNTLAGIKSDKKSKTGKINPMDKIDLQNSLIDRLFGGTEVNIKPQGSVDLSMGWLYSRRNDPNLPIRSQKQNQIDFPTPLIRVSVDGKIGKKLDLDFNYDTQSTFDFDRLTKISFDSDAFSKDDILKKIEVGNVSLPLRGNLIQGAQSLFGIKTETQFGRLRLTTLFSQQRAKAGNIRVENGVATQEFSITPNEYDENRHFFLSHYNRETYERNLSNIPYIGTPHQIAQIEVWISDDRPEYQDNSTMITAIADLGEPDATHFTSNPANNPVNCQAKDDAGLCLPRNYANTIYGKITGSKDIVDIDEVAKQLSGPNFNLKRTRDFEVFRGRRLSPSEYTYHPKLGTLSLNTRLRPNQVLGVAYNYYYTSNCDTLYQVGQLSASSTQPGSQVDTTRVEPPKVFFVKLLKSTNQVTTSPMWDLMMKNVYNLRTAQLSQQDFEFDIFYEDDFNDATLKKFLPEPELNTVPLLQYFNLDRLNRFGDPQPDGIFDYISGVTVVERTGSIIIPILEPFGSHMSVEKFEKALGGKKLVKVDEKLFQTKYRYQELYDTTISIAMQNLTKNKFKMEGKVKSSTSNNGEIQLGFNVPQGSVRVTAGGKQLIEGQDYEIDYSSSRLRIINPTYLAQGTPIDVRYEDNSAFNLQQRNMLGLRADYQFNKNSNLGFTYLRMYERPFTTKVNIGDDPINNRIFGFDYNLQSDVPILTKWVDKLPFYSTKEKSSINLTAEAAAIVPGHAKGINIKSDDPNIAENSGIANIDDFEGAITSLNLGGFNYSQWTLASTPSTSDLSTNIFSEATLDNNLAYGANRARLNWYVLDQGTNRTLEDSKNPYTRTVSQNQLFTNRQVQPGQQIFYTFDLSYYPSERGPYNFDTRTGIPGISKGFKVENNKIVLNNPETRWGGIMRYFQNSDFEAANYESIEFWMLNPFMDRKDGTTHPENEEGEIIFNLGSVSEDIIKDNFLYFENALPTTNRKVPVTNTSFGKATVSIPMVNGFDLNEGSTQDLGFDGLNNGGESKQFESWMTSNNVANLEEVQKDPANDDFLFFNDDALKSEPHLLNRMKLFNGPQGNAPLNNRDENTYVRGNRYPDTEDINNNKSLDQTEAFYEYKIKIKKLNRQNELDTTIAGNHYRQTITVAIPGGETEKWYRFQIPIKDGRAVNGISGYRAIQFMRMYMTNFQSPKTFRLADFQLQRSQWRKQVPSCVTDYDPKSIEFSIDDVGLEENSGKQPFNYITPPGVVRTRAISTYATLFQDEKALLMKFKRLPDDCEVSMTKLANINLALYKRLQMFVHAERAADGPEIEDKKLAIVIRIGKDFDNSSNTALKTKGANNFYEYELPLTISKPSSGVASVSNIWPAENFINLPLDSLLELKRIRIKTNRHVRDTIELVVNRERGDIIRMVGNPSLGAVKVIQVALRNLDTQKEINGEVWINELRVTGFDESGGVAAQAKLQVQLADLGELNLAGNYSSIGFGALDKRLLERNREQTIQYDIAANLDAGKVLPKQLKISAPLYAQYQKTYIKPQFDPFDKDLLLNDKLSLIENSVVKDSIIQQAREEVTIKTFNVTNVRTQAGGTGKPWSPSNLAVSYAFTDNTKSDPIIKQDKAVTRSFGLDYTYARQSKYIEPLKFIKVNALKILSDFNFSILPSNFTFTSKLINQNNSRIFRLPSTPVFIFDDKRFRWERNYVLDWDLTKSLRFNFRANSTAVIDQIRQSGIAETPEGREWYDREGVNVTENVKNDPTYPQTYRNQNLRNLGRSKSYTHNVSLNYRLPFKSIPILDWINAGADYKADYGWDGGSLITIDDQGTPLGNTIRNGQNTNLNFTFDFSKLYSKVGYLKSIESGKASRTSTRRKASSQAKSRKSNNDGVQDMQKAPETIAGSDGDSAAKEKKEDKPRDPSVAERVIIRPLMLVRSVKFNFRDDRTSVLPGFMPQSQLLGQSDGFVAPGWNFIAGIQPNLAGENNWLVQNYTWFNPSHNFNDALTQTKRKTFDAKLLVEPFKDFSIDINLKKGYQETHTEVFRNKKMDTGEKFLQLAKYDVGSFDASFYAMNTLFDNSFGLYNQFKTNKEVIARRLPNIPNPKVHPSDPAFPEGYGPSHNSVTVPAFIAAYTRKSPYDIELDQQKLFAQDNYIPKPNWQLNYNGLSKLKIFKDIFSNISIKHGYNSSIRVNNFQTSPNYNAKDPFVELSPNNNYFSRLEIPSVNIQEQFVPIIGISVKTIKDMKLEFEYKMTRNLELGYTQLREAKSKEIVFGGGYIIKNLKSFSNKKKSKKSKKKDGDATPDDSPISNTPRTSEAKSRDIRININYSLRDDISQIYDLLTGIDAQADRGSKSVTLNPTVEYDVNKNLALRFYFDYSKITPRTTLSYPVTTIRSGVTLRFNIN
jgi:cell surface protein SprA